MSDSLFDLTTFDPPLSSCASLTDEQQRVQDRDTETQAGWPTGYSMIVQLREALGLFAGAMLISPARAWDEALTEVRWRTQRLGGQR